MNSSLEYFETDANGFIKFPHTHFSNIGIGNAEYTIGVSCEGFTKELTKVYVKSSVKYLSFTNKPPDKITVLHPGYLEYHLIFSIQVLDKNY